MKLIGIFFLIVGVAMNIILLRRASAIPGATAADVLRSMPYRVALLMVGIGVVLLIVLPQ